MANQNRGGLIQIKVDGALFSAKGDFTCNLGGNKREAILGSDGVHGYKEAVQVPFFEGAITLTDEVTPGTVKDITDATAIVTEACGRTTVFRQAFFAGEGSWTTGEGEMAVRFEAVSAKEI